MAHEDVTFKGDGHGEPRGDARRHVEDEVRMRIQVSEHPVSGDRAHFKQEYRQRVEDVVNELDDVTDRERRQINVCRRRH